MRGTWRIIGFVCLALAAVGAEPTPRELYRALNQLRVDPGQIYFVRDTHLRRDIVRISLAEGKLALLKPHAGKVLGAVFTGNGRVLAVPRDPVEKHSLARFLGEPLLDQQFSRAYFRFTDETADELLRLLARAEAVRLEEPSFTENWDTIVGNINPWHSLRAMADLLAEHHHPYFYAGLASESFGAFDLLVDHRRDEQILIGQPQWLQGVRFYNVWASFKSPEGSPSLGPAFLPLRFEIQTTIRADLTLQGQTVLTLRAARGGERMIPLELSRHLRVEAVTDEQGTRLEFFQNEELSNEEIAQRGNDSLFVVLPRPARPGEQFRLAARYEGGVISDAGNGVYFVGERGSWYPHVGGANHFTPFELAFRWPRRLKLVATGRPVEETEEAEWRAGRWVSEVPIPVAGFNLGEWLTERVSAGRWQVEIHANRQLEEVVMRRFTRPAVPPTVPRPLVTRPGAPPQVPRILLPEPPPPSPAMVMKELGQDVAEAIRFYEKFMGPFPYERLAIAQIPGSFGQGWPGLMYLSTLSFLPVEAQARVGISRRTREQFVEIVPFHEAAHQWWGNMVSWADYRDQWIQEGLANYLALLYADTKRPAQKELASWLETYRQELLTPRPGSDERPEEIGPLALGYRLRSSKSPGAYTDVIYGKGTWVFHMLRMMLRDGKAKDPDARFGQLLRTLVQEHRHDAVTTQDLKRAVERLMTPAMDLEGTKSMDWFFEQWVRRTGIPRYSVNFRVAPQGQAFRIRGVLKQSGVPETFVAAVPLYAPRPSGRPLLLGRVITTGPETPFEFTAPVRPRRLLIDPEMTLLCVTE